MSAWKPWLTALLVLLYLTFRYRFSADGTIKEIEDGRANQARAMLVDFARREIEASAMGLRPGALVTAAIDEAKAAMLDHRKRSNSNFSYVVDVEFAALAQANAEAVEARVSVTSRPVERPGPGTETHDRQVTVVLTVTRRRWIKTLAFYRSWIWSKMAIERLFPMIVATGATVVCIWKLVLVTAAVV